MKKLREPKGITLIALVITIIILLILAGISIATLTGENGILNKASKAKEETEIKGYCEKIELIRNELRLEKENYLPPIIAEMKEEFDNNQTDWVASTEIKQVNGIEILELKTKEGYIFHITDTGTEYKGKDNLPIEEKELKVVAKNTDTSQLVRKTQMLFDDLFEVTWERDGIGSVEYNVLGNLNFQNKSFTSEEINNLSELEIGNYTITCKVTSPSKKIAIATKENVRVTKLANTTVTSTNNSEVEANAIYSEYDLAYFRDLVNNGQSNINVKVKNDIDLEKVCGIEVGNWEAIGNENFQYKGIFDGDGKLIKNIYINGTENNEGMFGVIREANIKNVVLTGNIESTGSCIGGIIGSGSGEIYNCKSSVILKGRNEMGGIIGKSIGTIKMNSCINNGKVEGGEHIGGIVGCVSENNKNDNLIKQCNNFGNIKGSSYGIGGIVGGCQENYLEINSCINDGDVEAGSGAVGGIIAYSYGNIRIENCMNKKSVKNVTALAGGIMGMIKNTQKNVTAIIYMCANKGKVDAQTAASGILTYVSEYASMNIEGSYNEGMISSRNHLSAGIFGSIEGNSNTVLSAVGCYNVGKIIGNQYSGALYGIYKWNYSGDYTGNNNFYLEGCGGAGNGATVKSEAELKKIYEVLPQYYKYNDIGYPRLNWET